MRIHYDVKGDVLYIEFKKGTVTTRRIDEDVAIDYDEKGWVAGIEVLSARERVLGKKERGIVSSSLKIVGDRFTLLGSLGFSLS